MQSLRKHIAFRLFWLITALHVLNCGIDTPDARPDCVPEDLAFNDMECIVEVVLEQVLGINNAIMEYDEHDAGDIGNEDITEVIFYYQAIVPFTLASPSAYQGLPTYPLLADRLLTQWGDISAPPPKA
jgi:hypothetical protein